MENKRIQYECPCVRIVQVNNIELLVKSTSSENLTIGKSKLFFEDEDDTIKISKDSVEIAIQYWEEE